jgi:5-oxopent-3-ene-1,2,5-tricarboxylate decarboxylase / 2-hydroxyhepta-2,4-diene-1,7-dioate isomerase
MQTLPLSGTVYGVLLNHSPQLLALGDAASQKPYNAPPKHPVLQLKPRNTLAGDGAPVVLSVEQASVCVGASLGILIGRTACRVAANNAFDFVAGYLPVNDLFLPHESHYRPAVRMRAHDGFCVIGTPVAAALILSPDALAVRVRINGVVVHETTTANRIRGVAQLLSDVTAFMTLQAGDVLMLGVSHGAPVGQVGQTVNVEIDGIGSVTNPLVGGKRI